ncbi:MAG TPA: hypothetical protein VG273_13860 [Bryobacteraceae bacterium]|jgi:sugar lactone lactonase YvrE|nr:hypothetical protein [Bryobacteraceae bacterium]
MKSYCVLISLAGIAAVCASAQTSSPAFSTGQAARLVLGQPTFTTASYGTTNTVLGSTSGLAYANGYLWVADSNRLGALPNNDRVLRYSDTATYPTPTQDPTVQGNLCSVCRGQASLVLGQPDFITSDFAISRAGMRNPTGIATDGTILVVADTDNNRILIWNSLPTATDQPADVVIGQADFTHAATSLPPTAKSLRGPEGVWLAGGKLYVADTQDNRILIYNKVPTSNNASADVVIGQPNFTSFVQPDLTQAVNATPSASNMQTPVSVSTDGTRMFVADLGQSRVLIWNTIPTSNGAAADVAIGQPDLVTAIDNNSFHRANLTADADGNYPGDTPVLCQSNAVDSENNPVFPLRCAATVSYPRSVISDGKQLFIADGGNDRILVYYSIPTVSGAAADAVLGQPDAISDNATDNPVGTNALQTPSSLAWDAANQNLYVSDTYNRRVVVFTPGVLNIPLNGIRNAASLKIYAFASVLIEGTIVAKDTITVTIAGTDYTYTIVAADTLASVADGLAKLINKAPDPNVVATVDDTTATLILAARVDGPTGQLISLATTVSNGAQISPVASGLNLSYNAEDPTSIAPGTLIDIFGTNLCDNTDTADLSQPYLPFTLASCQVYADGNQLPLLYASPGQINAQMPLFFIDRTSTSIYVRNIHADGSITVSSNVAATIVGQNPGIFAQGGSDPRPGIVFHGSSFAVSSIAVNGLITAGDIGNITIGSASYSYTVQAADTLTTVANALINLINSAPDPNVYAYLANENNTIILSALVPGPAGEGTAVTASVTSASSTVAAALLLNATNSTLCCDNQQGAMVTLDNPALPGEFVYLFATGLGPTNPSDQDTGQVFQGGSANPPSVPVDSILTGSFSGNLVSTALLPGTVGVYYVLFQISPSATTDPLSQTTIAQQFFLSNVVTFPVLQPGSPFTTTAAATTAARKLRLPGVKPSK